MSEVDLAKWMIRWRELKEELAGLELNIEREIKNLEKTQVVAGVRATYSKGSSSSDYKGAVIAAFNSGDPRIIDALRAAVAGVQADIIKSADTITNETLPSPIYTAMAKEYSLEVSRTVSAPSVTIKMENKE